MLSSDTSDPVANTFQSNSFSQMDEIRPVTGNGTMKDVTQPKRHGIVAPVEAIVVSPKYMYAVPNLNDCYHNCRRVPLPDRETAGQTDTGAVMSVVFFLLFPEQCRHVRNTPWINNISYHIQSR